MSLLRTSLFLSNRFVIQTLCLRLLQLNCLSIISWIITLNRLRLTSRTSHCGLSIFRLMRGRHRLWIVHSLLWPRVINLDPSSKRWILLTSICGKPPQTKKSPAAKRKKCGSMSRYQVCLEVQILSDVIGYSRLNLELMSLQTSTNQELLQAEMSKSKY